MNFDLVYKEASDEIKDLLSHKLCAFVHGSYVYGTNNENSDIDIVVIVDDDAVLTNAVSGIYEVQLDNYDFQFIHESTFIDMMRNYNIIAIESLWMSDDMYDGEYKYAQYYTLNNWEIRKMVSSIASNSWAKCHKKLVIEKDYDWYRAIKSLFHCFRLYDFGLQIVTTGKIFDYSHANKYWNELYTNDCVPTHEWAEYKRIYQSRLNQARSELVKLCDKPL